MLSAACQIAVELAIKFVPVNVSVRSAEPTVALAGEMEVIVGV